jgi:hypothetical protein
MKQLFSISFFDKLNVAAAKWKVRKIRGSNHLLHDGNWKVTKKQGRRSCNIYGEAKLRTAFTRRSLAFDQALLSFTVQEIWHTKLFFTTLMKVIHVSHHSRGELQIAGSEPLDGISKS